MAVSPWTCSGSLTIEDVDANSYVGIHNNVGQSWWLACGRLMRLSMRTVQLTLDDDLVKEVDALAESLGSNRSAFTRKALREAIERIREEALERQHREGYRRKPVRRGEFPPAEADRAWGPE